MLNGAVHLLGLPYDGSSTFARGAADAPAAIRRALASGHWNGWSETGVDTAAPGLLVDHGDLALDDGDAAASRAAIEAGVREVLARGRLLALGGDHAVTYPAVRAAAAVAGPLTVVHVDAHADLYDTYEGDRYSHASPFARIMEEGLARRLVQVGVRTLNAHQREQAARFGVEVTEMARWTGRLETSALEGPVYLSVDVDALDPAFAPGVSHREPGGLTVREVVRLVQTLPGDLVAADLVEYNPRRDVDDLTATVCAKLVKEMVARLHLGAPRA